MARICNLEHRFPVPSEIKTEILVKYDIRVDGIDDCAVELDTVHVLLDGSEAGWYDDDTLPPALRARISREIPETPRHERAEALEEEAEDERFQREHAAGVL